MTTPSSSASVNQPYFAALLHRLDAGEQPQDLMAEVAQDALSKPFNFGEMVKCFQALIEHGAHMATSEPGCAFELLIKGPATTKTLVFSDVLKCMLSSPGELPLHVLARAAPAHLLKLSKSPWPPSDAAFNKRDEHARTVSHYLWGPDGLLTDHANDARAAQGGNPGSEEALAKLWVGSVRVAWEVQQMLQARGASMDIPDNDGVTAMDLCLARITAEDAVLFPGKEVCRQVKAYQDSQGMKNNTPQADPPKAGIRF